MYMFINLISIVSICLLSVDCAKILCIAPMASHSHFIIGSTIFKELARRGHEVTVISPYPQQNAPKNYKDLSIAALNTNLDETKKQLFDMNKVSVLTSMIIVEQMTAMVTETLLSHPDVQKLLKSDERFDAVVMEYFLNEALMSFAHRFGAPLVLISPMPASMWTNHLVANPSSSAYIPNLLSTFGSEMTFAERATNALYDAMDAFMREWVHMPAQQRLLDKYNPQAPPVSELRYNTSIFLVNSHESMNGAVPHVPNMIQIGGYHVTPAQELPKDLKAFMDGAKEGVIVFSMGSNLKSADLPVETRQEILRAFAKIKQKVLWKFEEDIPNLPSNVKIMKWLPQKDLIAHPHVSCLITHGGALSTIEAVFFGVPIIGIPVFGDQQMNMARAVKEGYAVQVPLSKVREETLTEALKQVLENTKYRDEVKRRSSIMHDRQVKPLDSAMYWIEYAIRHKGAHHLRSAALNLKWYQISMLDVYLCVVVALYIVYLLASKLVAAVCGNYKKRHFVNKNKKQR